MATCCDSTEPAACWLPLTNTAYLVQPRMLPVTHVTTAFARHRCGMGAADAAVPLFSAFVPCRIWRHGIIAVLYAPGAYKLATP